ncbi:hypothetical protein V6N12_044437 [Hibiscus sabdariffa]|uniref:Uncharacterized protein n=1 Tax=Hibiscus sabdariffa TaxID=183260 RepID=A0ABR2BN16_9ROSI
MSLVFVKAVLKFRQRIVPFVSPGISFGLELRQSTRQVIERRSLQPEKIDKLDTTPSLELQLESATRNMLSKEVAEKTRELRQLRGEEL